MLYCCYILAIPNSGKKILNCTYLYLNIGVLGILQETAEPIKKKIKKAEKSFCQ